MSYHISYYFNSILARVGWTASPTWFFRSLGKWLGFASQSLNAGDSNTKSIHHNKNWLAGRICCRHVTKSKCEKGCNDEKGEDLG